ncbi:MAG: DoxX family protein [Actinobacteria bacterium]|nr:DoxX family protein [Actinomycetota bacterium]
MDIVLIVGRILFALIFINSGFAHFAKREVLTGYAQFKKVPAAKLAVPLTGLMILLGGLSIVLGIWMDLGALLLAIFLVFSAFMMHNFWTMDDATQKMNETVAFFKNLSMAGAALIILAVIANGGDLGANLGDVSLFRN